MNPSHHLILNQQMRMMVIMMNTINLLPLFDGCCDAHLQRSDPHVLSIENYDDDDLINDCFPINH